MLYFYRFLECSVALLHPEKTGRWPVKVQIIKRLFQSLTPDYKAIKLLHTSINIVVFKELSHPLQLQYEESVGQSMLGINNRVSECCGLVTLLPTALQHEALVDMVNIMQTQEPPFHHIFVDEAEDLCRAFHDNWWMSLRSLHKGGYFWQTYDPLSLANMPGSLKNELKGAHSLLTVLRNTGSVSLTWTSNLSAEGDFSLHQIGPHDQAYKREEIGSGHNI